MKIVITLLLILGHVPEEVTHINEAVEAVKLTRVVGIVSHRQDLLILVVLFTDALCLYEEKKAIDKENHDLD